MPVVFSCGFRKKGYKSIHVPLTPLADGLWKMMEDAKCTPKCCQINNCGDAWRFWDRTGFVACDAHYSMENVKLENERYYERLDAFVRPLLPASTPRVCWFDDVSALLFVYVCLMFTKKFFPGTKIKNGKLWATTMSMPQSVVVFVFSQLCKSKEELNKML
jgi:hypothetical protein